MSDSPASVIGIAPHAGLPPMLNPGLFTAEELAARCCGATLMSSSAFLQHRGVHRGGSFLGASTASTSLIAPAPQPMPKNSLHTLSQSCAAINVQATSPAAKGETALEHEVRRICADRMAEASHLHMPLDSSLEISPMQASAANGRRAPSQPGSGDDAADHRPDPWPPTAVCVSAAVLFRRNSSVRLKENVVLHHRELLAKSPQCRSANRTPAAESPSKSPQLAAANMVSLAPMSNINSTSSTSASVSPGSETASPQSPGANLPGSGRRSAAAHHEHHEEPAWATSMGH
jgi:hypothetical protein